MSSGHHVAAAQLDHARTTAARRRAGRALVVAAVAVATGVGGLAVIELGTIAAPRLAGTAVAAAAGAPTAGPNGSARAITVAPLTPIVAAPVLPTTPPALAAAPAAGATPEATSATAIPVGRLASVGTASLPPIAPSPPVAVVLPSIGVDSPLEELALGPGGELDAPADPAVAGWYQAGPEPGQIGPAVIAGHVDDLDGPAVFYRLSKLAVGDEVQVRRADGGAVVFVVQRVEQYAKDAFPTDEVYGAVPDAELRLITCGGSFDRKAGHYRANTVVYAVATGFVPPPA